MTRPYINPDSTEWIASLGDGKTILRTKIEVPTKLRTARSSKVKINHAAPSR